MSSIIWRLCFMGELLVDYRGVVYAEKAQISVGWNPILL